MRQLAEIFVEGAAEDGHVFDWDADSVHRLDEYCELFLASRPTDATAQSMIASMGAYLGELAIRNADGRWTYDPEQQAVAVETLGHLRSYPHSKVGKRLGLGRDHGLWAFYHYAVSGQVPPAARLNPR